MMTGFETAESSGKIIVIRLEIPKKKNHIIIAENNLEYYIYEISSFIP